MQLNVDQFRTCLQAPLNLCYRLGLDTAVCRILNALPIHAVLESIWFRDFSYYQGVTQNYRERLAKSNVTLRDKHVLEIGSGNSLGTGYFFLGEVASFTASDIRRTPTMSRRVFRVEVDMIQRLKTELGIDVDRYVEIDRARRTIGYRDGARFLSLDIASPTAVAQAGGDGTFDLILSVAVLEHLPRQGIPAAIANLRALLVPGGYMLHWIDMRDHFNLDYPFHFYQYTEPEWNRLASNHAFYTNRLRAQEFEQLFHQARLDIVASFPSSSPLRLEPSRLEEHFKGRSDLDISGVCYLLRRADSQETQTDSVISGTAS